MSSSPSKAPSALASKLAFMNSFGALVVYMTTAIGYILADSLSSFYRVNVSQDLWNWVYTLLAALYLLNAIQYFLEYLPDWSGRFDEAFWANAINLFASAVYVLSAVLYFFFPSDDGGGPNGQLATAHAAVQSSLALMAAVLYVVDALLFNSWYFQYRADLRKNPFHFWAELFNTLPSIGLLGTTTFQLFSQLDNQFTKADHLRNTKMMARINVIFDLLWAFDALLCFLAFARDHRIAKEEAYSHRYTEVKNTLDDAWKLSGSDLESFDEEKKAFLIN